MVLNAMRRATMVLALCMAWNLCERGALAAAPADELGSARDHPLISRFPGSKIIGYWQRDWDQTAFPLGAEMDASDRSTFKTSVAVDGMITRIVYLGPVGKSALEVFRNYQEALTKAGLTPKFSCASDCGQIFWRWRFGPVNKAMTWSDEDLHSVRNPADAWNARDAVDAKQGRAVYGTLAQAGRQIHILVYTSVAGYEDTGASATVIEIAEPKPMQAGQVTVDARALLNGLSNEGKVALYGLYFDTGKALIKPESKAQLDEMARLLREHPSLDVFIVGHTDNQGLFDANLALSRQRAEAVRDALVGGYRIAAGRLTSYGVANVAPLASNAGEAGRARNRRVEMVAR